MGEGSTFVLCDYGSANGINSFDVLHSLMGMVNLLMIILILYIYIVKYHLYLRFWINLIRITQSKRYLSNSDCFIFKDHLQERQHSHQEYMLIYQDLHSNNFNALFETVKGKNISLNVFKYIFTHCICWRENEFISTCKCNNKKMKKKRFWTNHDWQLYAHWYIAWLI